MPWDYWPVAVGGQITNAEVWQELVEAINERCSWAGISTLSSPSTGNAYISSATIKEIQQKIEYLVPYFTNPSGLVSGSSVSYSPWTFTTLMQDIGYLPNGEWRYQRNLLGGTPYFNYTGQAPTGAIAAHISYYSIKTLDMFLEQFHSVIDALRWTTASGSSWASIQDFRWISSRPTRIYSPPASGGEIGDATGGDYVEDYWPNTTWGSVSSGTPTNGPQDMIVSTFLNPQFGEYRWIDKNGFQPGTYNIEVARQRRQFTLNIPAGGDKREIHAYQLPHTHTYDWATGGITNEIISTGTPESVALGSGHVTGTFTTDWLQNIDTIPSPTPVEADVSGSYLSRMNHTYKTMMTEVPLLIEINFDKMT